LRAQDDFSRTVEQIVTPVFGIAKFVLALNPVKITSTRILGTYLRSIEVCLRGPSFQREKADQPTGYDGEWTCIHARLGDETWSFIDLVSYDSKGAKIHHGEQTSGDFRSEELIL
jgi:hypothetical protein